MSALADQQAFPVPSTSEHFRYPGMTLRQYYAGLAMQALIANSSDVQMRVNIKDAEEHGETEQHQTYARQAREHADALLAELEKGKESA